MLLFQRDVGSFLKMREAKSCQNHEMLVACRMNVQTIIIANKLEQRNCDLYKHMQTIVVPQSCRSIHVCSTRMQVGSSFDKMGPDRSRKFPELQNAISLAQ